MLQFRPLFQLSAAVAPPVDVGTAETGRRRVVSVTGGTFSGERLSGRLLAAGTDVQRIRADDTAELRIHACLETDAGDRILLSGHGLRHAPPDIGERMARGENPDSSLCYFREAITFETGSQTLAWLTRLLAIGSGRRTKDRVLLDVFELL